MVQHANHLEELRIGWPTNVIQHFDENDYDEMLRLVKNRSTHTKLDVEFTNQTTLFDVSDGLKRKLVLFEREPEWLRVSNYSKLCMLSTALTNIIGAWILTI